jgi:hypothetical protein
MPGEGSSLWREHERSIATSRPVHYLDVREVKAPSRFKEKLKSVGWAMPVAERLRSCPPDRDIPGPPPLLRCAAQPLPCLALALVPSKLHEQDGWAQCVAK